MTRIISKMEEDRNNIMDKFTLTSGQQEAFDKFKHFIQEDKSKVFILKGHAGTGKTTLIKKFIGLMQDQQLSFSLLASTGRAAKVLANTTGCEAKTIHSEIYKFSDLNQDLEKIVEKREKTKVDSSGQLYLNFELSPKDSDIDEKSHFYIIDESSMIADLQGGISQATFGSGKLLTDLFKYDYNGKFIFVGDECQLPPVSQKISPALSSDYIKNTFGFSCKECELTDIVRQASDVDIVRSANKIRKLVHNPQPWKWAKFPMRTYKNIHILNSQISLMKKYVDCVNELGFNKSTLLCFSNKQCSIRTQLLRPSFGHNSHTLEKGDLLLITQNNLISGLMNGDLVVVEDVVIQEKRAGLTFLMVAVKELFTKLVYSQLMIADILYGNLTNLTQTQQKELYVDFYYRMKDEGIGQKSPMFQQKMISDPYLNALRAVFGYALTCHKSQGGEWDYVFLDIPKQVSALEKPYVYQWVYTAMTRAKKELYVVDDFWLI